MDELPKYKCHKEVWALQIRDILYDKHVAQVVKRESDGGAMITPENDHYAAFKVSREYISKHNPEIGGYYVVYEDGYKSYSPAKAFKESYTLKSVPEY